MSCWSSCLFPCGWSVDMILNFKLWTKCLELIVVELLLPFLELTQVGFQTIRWTFHTKSLDCVWVVLGGLYKFLGLSMSWARRVMWNFQPICHSIIGGLEKIPNYHQSTNFKKWRVNWKFGLFRLGRLDMLGRLNLVSIWH